MDTLFPKLVLLIIFSLIIIFNKNARKEFIELTKTEPVRYIVFPILLYVIFVIILLSIGVKINPPHLLTIGLFAVLILGEIITFIKLRKKEKQDNKK